jgi:phosphohistidine phosphatase
MPRILLVMRHAKAATEEIGESDISRQLTRNGKADAERLGTILRERNLVPSIIASSPAKRALMTAKRVGHCSGFSDELQVEDTLYMRGHGAYLAVITEWPDEAVCGMVVGHNPDVSNLVNLLTGTHAELVTAAIAVIQVPSERWAGLNPMPRCKLLEILS